MQPRVFISSTYYDLKYVRERLETFIKNYGFEPVLFESDKITYQQGKTISQSAYHEVELCHIMILIIGGRYGTPVENTEEHRKRYDEEFVSITRKEFEAAVKKEIPIFIFVDKNVNSEYETYKKNKDFIDYLYSAKPERKFEFAHIDHINVFRFLDELKVKPIKVFDKVEEIESYIRSQFSGLFYLYLEELKKQSQGTIILDRITELKSVTLRMDEMLTSVGRQILESNEDEYRKVIENQFSIMLDYYTEKFASSISFTSTFSKDKLKKIDTKKIAEIIYTDALKLEVPSLTNWKKYEEVSNFDKKTDKDILNNLQQKIAAINAKLELEKLDYRLLNREFKQKVSPFVKGEKDENLLIERLQKVIEIYLSELAFKITK